MFVSVPDPLRKITRSSAMHAWPVYRVPQKPLSFAGSCLQSSMPIPVHLTQCVVPEIHFFE